MPSAIATIDDAYIGATYAIAPRAGSPASVARAIAYEQTVELPESLVTDPAILDAVVGRVGAVWADSDQHHARIDYPASLCDGHLPQLLNLLFGNVSFYPGVRLVGLELPDDVLARITGPRLGVEGLRTVLGVYDRPLLATALKPRGTTDEQLASAAQAFALGGGDLVKDDQNLADDLEAFKRRVERCAGAVAAANLQTGRRCLYLPHITGPADELDRRFAFVAELGLEGVLACPLIMGLDTVRTLAVRHHLAVMAHPSLAGAYVNEHDSGIDPAVLLGTLFRLAGADISIFPNAGGRFAFTAKQCTRIADALRAPLGSIAPAWACPAGGMRFDNIRRMCTEYGPDAILLVGGALLGHGADLRASTADFAGAIRARFPGRETEPAPGPAPGRTRGRAPLAERLLRHGEGYEWTARPSSPYKDASNLSFKRVRRVELVGKFGERTNADLRYFEVQPGGYSSMERHLHTHLIIGARGTGVLVLGNERCELGPYDVAYVEPLEPHQLRNEGDEPFGFFCIVDHERDRPARC
jgi:ribulose-bisphosphate carboxylase large chain